MNKNVNINKIRDLIAKDELDNAFSELRTYPLDNSSNDEVILQYAQLNEVKKFFRLGVISFTDVKIEKSRIRLSLLEFLAQIEKSNYQFSLYPINSNEEKGITKIKIETKEEFKIPKTKVWTSGYGRKIAPNYYYYYCLHRLAKDYYIMNQDINLRAEKYIELIKNLQNGIDDVQTETIEVQEAISNEMYPPESLKRFRKKLLGRRICIGMFNLLSLEKDEAYVAIKYGKIYKPRESNMTINPFFSVYLGFKLGIAKSPYLKEDQFLQEELIWYNQYKKEFIN